MFASAKPWFLDFFSVSNRTVDPTHVHLRQGATQRSTLCSYKAAHSYPPIYHSFCIRNVLTLNSRLCLIHLFIISPLQAMAWLPSVPQHSHQLLFRCLSFLLYRRWLPGKPSMFSWLLFHPLTHHQSSTLYPLFPGLSHPPMEWPGSSRCFSQSHSSCLVNFLLGSAGFVFGVSCW